MSKVVIGHVTIYAITGLLLQRRIAPQNGLRDRRRWQIPPQGYRKVANIHVIWYLSDPRVSWLGPWKVARVMQVGLTDSSAVSPERIPGKAIDKIGVRQSWHLGGYFLPQPSLFIFRFCGVVMAGRR